MRTIRRGVFETNSSSVHSLTIVSKEEFEKWQNGELLYNRDYKKLVNPSEVEYADELITYDKYPPNDEYEYFGECYTTKNGDEIVAFGYYREDR